ncbi:hypothetical protein GCM10010250_50880 [Streptomyces althioticus]|nr:hypothetical protein GCM10010250_50880 [Streptomyces althioticus]
MAQAHGNDVSSDRSPVVLHLSASHGPGATYRPSPTRGTAFPLELRGHRDLIPGKRHTGSAASIVVANEPAAETAASRVLDAAVPQGLPDVAR